MPLSSEGVWVPALSGACCVAAFLVRQNRISHPLIYLGVFRARQYRAAFVAQNCLFASFMGITLIVPLFVQGICGLSALDAGIVFVPATVIALFLNPLAGLLTDRVGARAVTVTGAVLLVVGAASMMFVDAATPLWLLTAMQAVRALGVSTLVGPLNSWGLSGLLPASTMDGSVFFATGPPGVCLARHGAHDAARGKRARIAGSGGCGRRGGSRVGLSGGLRSVGGAFASGAHCCRLENPLAYNLLRNEWK